MAMTMHVDIVSAEEIFSGSAEIVFASGDGRAGILPRHTRC